MNREAWLTAAAEELWPLVLQAGGARPETFRVSCGWPSRRALMTASSRSRVLGQAWHGGSEDGAREVFISPALAHPVEVLDVLGHELVHAALPGGTKHGSHFQAVCKGMGWEAKQLGASKSWRSAGASDQTREEVLKPIAEKLGAYPHAKLDAEPSEKQQKARLLKGECPDCGYIIRVTRTWIEVGMPTCPCGSELEAVEVARADEHEAVDLVESHLIYRSKDGRFTFTTTKRGKGSQTTTDQWIVTDHEAYVSGERETSDGLLVTTFETRMTVRQNRADALAFAQAIRDGGMSWEAVETAEEDAELLDEDELDEVLGEVGFSDDGDGFLADDEDEHPDYPEDAPEDEDDYAVQTARREASGEAKSLSIIAAGGEGAMD